MGQLERCLDAIGVAFSALERETDAAQVMTIDAQTCIMGKGFLRLVVLSGICSF